MLLQKRVGSPDSSLLQWSIKAMNLIVTRSSYRIKERKSSRRAGVDYLDERSSNFEFLWQSTSWCSTPGKNWLTSNWSLTCYVYEIKQLFYQSKPVVDDMVIPYVRLLVDPPDHPSVCLSMCLFVCQSVCLSVFVCPSVFVCLCRSFLSLSVCLCLCLSDCMYVCMSVCLCLPVCLSTVCPQFLSTIFFTEVFITRVGAYLRNACRDQRYLRIFSLHSTHSPN